MPSSSPPALPPGRRSSARRSTPIPASPCSAPAPAPRPRTSSIPAGLPPDLPAVATRVARVESLRPGGGIPLSGGGAFHIWREITDGTSEVVETTADGEAAVRRAGNLTYLAGWPDGPAMRRLMRAAAAEAGLPTLDLPDGLRRRTTPAETFWFNYAAHPLPLAGPAGDPTLPAELAPAGVHRVMKG
jgi:beta-galactosidase